MKQSLSILICIIHSSFVIAGITLDLELTEVMPENNGLTILAQGDNLDVSDLTRKASDLSRNYKESGQWNQETVDYILKESSPLFELVEKALSIPVWQVTAISTLSSPNRGGPCLLRWFSLKRIEYYDALQSQNPRAAYEVCKITSEAGLRLLESKGDTLIFLTAYAIYDGSLHLLKKLRSEYPDMKFPEHEASTEAIRNCYRNMIIHEYQSALSAIDEVTAEVRAKGYLPEHGLMDVPATKALIANVYLEALENTYREPNDYIRDHWNKVNRLAEEWDTVSNIKNRMGLKLLNMILHNPEDIWQSVINKQSQLEVAKHSPPEARPKRAAMRLDVGPETQTEAIIKTFAVSLAVVLVLWVARPVAIRRRFRRMAQKPDRPDEDGFIAAMRSKRIPDDVSRSVYRGFRKWASVVVPDFRVRTSDSLSDFWHVDAYDHVDILDDILRETGRSWPQERTRFSKKTTVEEIAQFVANCKKIEESKAQQGAAPLLPAQQTGPSEGAR